MVMLSLNQVKKHYTLNNERREVLKSISIDFPTAQFVAIMGPSGAGKTTLLNVIGGLDTLSGGSILINGRSTEHFKSEHWDRYRNHTIGFVFQNYHLITHLNVIDNVALGASFSEESSATTMQKATDALLTVGMLEYALSPINTLSSGQMQKVAIARALINNPSIILADEPTGALDSDSALEIMEIFGRIARHRLLIMVTHDQALAALHAQRHIHLNNGTIGEDSAPLNASHTYGKRFTRIHFPKTRMPFRHVFSLAKGNIVEQRFKTFLSALAGAIGILSVALVIGFTSGLTTQIDTLEPTLARLPLRIDPSPTTADNTLEGQFGIVPGDPWRHIPQEGRVYRYDDHAIIPAHHTNQISLSYMAHLDAIEDAWVESIMVRRRVRMPLIGEHSGEGQTLDTETLGFETTTRNTDFFNDHYTMIGGRAPENKHEAIVIVDALNRLPGETLDTLGVEDDSTILEMDAFLNLRYSVPKIDDYYTYTPSTDLFEVTDDIDALYQSDDAFNFRVVGVAKAREDTMNDFLSLGLKFHPDLEEAFISDARHSDVVAAQYDRDTSVLSGRTLSVEERAIKLRSLGSTTVPNSIRIFPSGVEEKSQIIDHLDAYNEGRDTDDAIIYTDLASVFTNISRVLIRLVSVGLVAIAAISLVVYALMNGIIIQTSVNERSREIGILRALGATRNDIERLFRMETLMIGLFSGIIGVLSAVLLSIVLRMGVGWLIPEITEVPRVPWWAILLLVALSALISVIAGFIPSKNAAKRPPINALRND